MEWISSIKKELADYLEEQMPGVGVMAEYPPRWGRRPCKVPQVAVGVNSLSWAGKGGQVQMELRFDLLAPGDWPGGCHQVFESLCQALAGLNTYRLGQISCGSLTYENQWDQLSLTAKASLEGLLDLEYDPQGPLLRQVVVQTESMGKG